MHKFETTDEQKYVILLADGGTGLDLILRMFDIMNPAGNNMAPAQMAQNLMQASSSNSPFVDKARDLIYDLLGLVLHNNKKITREYFSVHFQARYFQLYEVLMEVIIVNGFFDLIGAPLMNMLIPQQTPKKSAKISKKDGSSIV